MDNQIGSTDEDIAYGIAINSTSTYMYVVGYAKDPFQGFSVLGTSSSFRGKLDTATGTVQSAICINIDGINYMYGITMDSSDNTYFVGGYSSSLGYNGNAQIGSYDCTISKYDAAGNGIRHKTAGNNNNDWFYRVTVDTAGNVYAVGISVIDGSKTFGGASYYDQRDGVVQGYSSTGTEVMNPIM